MKTVILHNVYINSFTESNEKYLREARVTFAITSCVGHPYNSPSRNTVFLMWDDCKYDEERNIWDEKLSPSPIHRVCDFIRDIWEGSDSELEHLCNMVQQMRMGETLHYDVEGFTFNVKDLDKYNK